MPRLLQVSRRSLTTVAGLTALLALGMALRAAGPASSQVTAPGPFTYVVKFTCVPEVGPAQAVGVEAPFEPALYRTAVNIHNASRQNVTFTKKLLLTRSVNEPRGAVTSLSRDRLAAGQGLAVDCLDMQARLANAQSPGDGFVVIESPRPLEVVAVYTMLSFVGGAGEHSVPEGNGASIDVEYIKPRTP